MSKYFVKNEPGYEEESEFDADKIVVALKRRKNAKKVATSISLEATLIKEIKAVAKKQDVPFQVLLRMLVIDGFKRWKRAG